MTEQERLKNILKGMIEKTQNDIILATLDKDFMSQQSLIHPELQKGVAIKTGELKYLISYLDFLKVRLEESDKKE